MSAPVTRADLRRVLEAMRECFSTTERSHPVSWIHPAIDRALAALDAAEPECAGYVAPDWQAPGAWQKICTRPGCGLPYSDPVHHQDSKTDCGGVEGHARPAAENEMIGKAESERKDDSPLRSTNTSTADPGDEHAGTTGAGIKPGPQSPTDPAASKDHGIAQGDRLLKEMSAPTGSADQLRGAARMWKETAGRESDRADQAGEMLLEAHRLRCNQPEREEVRVLFERLTDLEISRGKGVEVVLDMIAGTRHQQHEATCEANARACQDREKAFEDAIRRSGLTWGNTYLTQIGMQREAGSCATTIRAMKNDPPPVGEGGDAPSDHDQPPEVDDAPGADAQADAPGALPLLGYGRDGCSYLEPNPDDICNKCGRQHPIPKTAKSLVAPGALPEEARRFSWSDGDVPEYVRAEDYDALRAAAEARDKRVAELEREAGGHYTRGFNDGKAEGLDIIVRRTQDALEQAEAERDEARQQAWEQAGYTDYRYTLFLAEQVLRDLAIQKRDEARAKSTERRRHLRAANKGAQRWAEVARLQCSENLLLRRERDESRAELAALRGEK